MTTWRQARLVIVLGALLLAAAPQGGAASGLQVSGRAQGAGSALREVLARRMLLNAGARRLAHDGADAVAVAAATAAASAGEATIKKCLWSDSAGGCALNPSYMFTLKEAPDSYERCVLCLNAAAACCVPPHASPTLPCGPSCPRPRHAHTPPPPPPRSVLLEITAMRYTCLVHGSEDECLADVRGWCAWGEGTCTLHFDEAGACPCIPRMRGGSCALPCCGVLQACGAGNSNLAAACSHKRRMRHVPPSHACSMSLMHARFNATDFVGLLLWSSVSLGCNGSLVADVVSCSFKLYRK